MEEILIVSNYYPPEKGAAANRIEQMALKLNQNKYKVTVVCPLGNYPKGELFPEYKGKFSVTEMLQEITVKRLWIYPSNSKNFIIRVFSILSFSISLFFFLMFKKTPKKVIVQSPPLLLSFISVFTLSFKSKKIILNVSDLWPLAAVELGVMKPNSLSHEVLCFLERYIYRKSTLILGQSNEIITHVKTIVPAKSCFLYRNFPDHKTTEFNLTTTLDEPIKLFYAGLLGVAQGVFELCKHINLKDLSIEFHIFGDGAEKKQIEDFMRNHPEKKIIFHGMMERNQLLDKLKTFDIALVPLKTRIYGSVPSKIFEYGSLGFPVLYFGGGEGEDIVNGNNMGWIAPVGDYVTLNKEIQQISSIQKNDLNQLKSKLYHQSKTSFNLDKQITDLLSKDVF
ncbi:glycosyltransferase family 4 protein [Flavobacterium lacus]|uniref:Glycosyltransferase involved in cell wall biosynthesis n=1 Tax=Flavobacterium lacus TaxID=1353778 RepID=A0A328X2U8_9FLAO|nr:glycosyltransferase family 4 protein [Flavobacterium lacus]RAR49728.1 glycosyltransferase involved in cell wall biosynthesis [Flavobacterium lacus]